MKGDINSPSNKPHLLDVTNETLNKITSESDNGYDHADDSINTGLESHDDTDADTDSSCDDTDTDSSCEDADTDYSCDDTKAHTDSSCDDTNAHTDYSCDDTNAHTDSSCDDTNAHTDSGCDDTNAHTDSGCDDTNAHTDSSHHVTNANIDDTDSNTDTETNESPDFTTDNSKTIKSMFTEESEYCDIPTVISSEDESESNHDTNHTSINSPSIPSHQQLYRETVLASDSEEEQHTSMTSNSDDVSINTTGSSINTINPSGFVPPVNPSGFVPPVNPTDSVPPINPSSVPPVNTINLTGVFDATDSANSNSKIRSDPIVLIDDEEKSKEFKVAVQFRKLVKQLADQQVG